MAEPLRSRSSVVAHRDRSAVDPGPPAWMAKVESDPTPGQSRFQSDRWWLIVSIPAAFDQSAAGHLRGPTRCGWGLSLPFEKRRLALNGAEGVKAERLTQDLSTTGATATLGQGLGSSYHIYGRSQFG